jgi:hypothetical protein
MDVEECFGRVVWTQNAAVRTAPRRCTCSAAGRTTASGRALREGSDEGPPRLRSVREVKIRRWRRHPAIGSARSLFKRLYPTCRSSPIHFANLAIQSFGQSLLSDSLFAQVVGPAMRPTRSTSRAGDLGPGYDAREISGRVAAGRLLRLDDIRRAQCLEPRRCSRMLRPRRASHVVSRSSAALPSWIWLVARRPPASRPPARWIAGQKRILRESMRDRLPREIPAAESLPGRLRIRLRRRDKGPGRLAQRLPRAETSPPPGLFAPRPSGCCARKISSRASLSMQDSIAFVQVSPPASFLINVNKAEKSHARLLIWINSF